LIDRHLFYHPSIMSSKSVLFLPLSYQKGISHEKVSTECVSSIILSFILIYH
jgi:hypothetical protein